MIDKDRSPIMDSPDISPRTVDRWIFEFEQRQRRKKEFQTLLYRVGMTAMVVIVILLPIHWALKVIGEAVLLWIAFMVWAIDIAKEIDEDPHPSHDELIMKKKLEEMKKNKNE